MSTFSVLFLFRDDFVSLKIKGPFSRLKIENRFLRDSITTWERNAAFIETKKNILSLKAVNDRTERAVKLLQDLHGFITTKEWQK